jgi:hypothetical protein
MKTIFTGLGKCREGIEAGVAVTFLILGVVLATGLLAMAFASAQSVQPSQVTVYGYSSAAAGGFDRSYRRGGGAAVGYQLAL